MKAKDTVMKKKWMSREVANDQNALLLEQAEISFKAGIREVVEWIDNRPDCLAGSVLLHKDEWQAKLEEWETE